MAALGTPIRLFNAGDPPYGLIASAREAVRGRISEPASERPADGDAASDFPTSPDSESAYRWVLGMTIEPEPCGGGFLADPCDADGPYGEGDVAEQDPIGPIQPLPATASTICGTFGSRYETRRDRTLRKLRATRSFQLEREFWTGIRAVAQGYTSNQWLTKLPAVVNFGAGMALATAFAELEQAIADGSSWATGMIHCQPRTFAHWYRLRLFDKVGNIGISPLGTVVVAGRGYPGTGPSGTGAGSAVNALGGDASYAYATSLVQVRLGPETVLNDEPIAGGVRGGSSLDATNNRIRVTADQPITANWDGCVHAAALVLHTSELSATGS